MKKNFMKKNFLKKQISAVMIFAMIISMVPATAFAQSAAATASTGQDSYGVDREWYNFRNNPENNGVTDSATPTDIETTAEKWAVKYGSGYSAAPTPPLILNGKLYTGVGNKVYELDKNTGKKLRESDEMMGEVGYAMNPITYADGKLFVLVGNGVIQAVDLKTLKCKWYTEKIGGQTLCPISHTTVDGKGYIYTGTWMGDNRSGSYYCVSTDDRGTVSASTSRGGGKVKSLKWKFTPAEDDEKLQNVSTEKNRGFYWAGAYATENFVAVGSDDGAGEGKNGKSTFYTLDSKSGKIIDRIENVSGDIRSTTVYNDGYLYFSTKGGVLYKAKVSDNGEISQVSKIDIGDVTGEKVMATASPVVYGNKIYMGVSGSGGQFDADAGHGFRVIDNSGDLSQNSILYNIPIPGYPQAAALASTAYVNNDYNGDGQADGRVYIYFTYNAKPGGIYYCYDNADQKESAKDQCGEIFIPSAEKQQYCISTICADREGTLYYKNDSCYLMAVERNPAYLKGIAITTEQGSPLSWNEDFDCRKTEYELRYSLSDKKVKVALDMEKGTTAKVNGKAYTKPVLVDVNEKEITLKVDMEAKSGVKVYKKSYSFRLRPYNSDAYLDDLKLGTSNSFNSFVSLSPVFNKSVTEYFVDTTESQSFWRVWVKKSGDNGTVEVTGGENVKKITMSEEQAGAQGYTRWNVYKEDNEKNASVSIRAVAEDGKSERTYSVHLLVNEGNPFDEMGKTKVTVKSAAYNKILLQWEAVRGAGGYDIYRATSKTGKYTKIKSVHETSFTDTSLTTGKTYYYKVRATLEEENGIRYNQYSSVKYAAPELDNVSSVKVSSGKKKLTVSWTKVSGATGYAVYRASSKSGKYSKITSTKNLSYVNKNLKKGKTYYYKVKAYKTVSGKKVYSKYYSPVKSGKVK